MKGIALLTVAALSLGATLSPAGPDVAYGRLLVRFVRGARVDYQALKADSSELDAAVASFDAPATRGEATWPRAARLAFWINAYNVFTLRAIVGHYPIQGHWLSIAPRNSIRQIDGVWTTLKWRVAGRDVTLDQIEHEILRPTFKDPRVHFAVNCASKSCPPLRAEPYDAGRLDAQLDDAARRYLASPYGVQVSSDVLKVSSIFKWYGDDFIARFAGAAAQGPPDRDRAILGVVTRYGPPAAAALAGSGRARIEFLDYDWSLNDLDRER